MTPEEIARGYAIDYWTHGRDAFVDEAFDPSATYHDPMLPPLPTGPDGPRQRKAIYGPPFPKATSMSTTWWRRVSGWRCAGAYTGRFTGESMGVAPTNEAVTVDGMHFFHVRDGRVVEDVGAVPTRRTSSRTSEWSASADLRAQRRMIGEDGISPFGQQGGQHPHHSLFLAPHSDTPIHAPGLGRETVREGTFPLRQASAIRSPPMFTPST